MHTVNEYLLNLNPNDEYKTYVKGIRPRPVHILKTIKVLCKW